MSSVLTTATSAALILASGATADFIGWTSTTRVVSGGFLVNVFAVTDNTTDVLLWVSGGSPGLPTAGFVTTNSLGGFRQGVGNQSVFAPNGSQNWTTLDSFLTVGGGFNTTTNAWTGNGATQGDPPWNVTYFDTDTGEKTTVSSFNTPGNDSGFTNPHVNSIPAATGWFIPGSNSPARNLAPLAPIRSGFASSGGITFGSSSVAAAAGLSGTLVAQLYVRELNSEKFIDWKMNASFRRTDGSLSSGTFQMRIGQVFPAWDSDGDGIPDASDMCPHTPGCFDGCPWSFCDSDGDGFVNAYDVCPWTPGFCQGCPVNVCGSCFTPPDADSDGRPDCQDNCPTVPNPSQADCDGDGQGDACENSRDCNGNGRPDNCDISSGISIDIDGDGVPDECQTSTVPGQFPTVQAAIDAAPASGMRIVQVAAGTYTGAVDFLGKRIVLRGAGAANTMLRATPGLAAVSVLRLSGTPAGTSIENLTIWGGTGSPIAPASSVIVGGGIYASDSTLSIRDVVFENNAAQFGGGVYALNSALALQRCTFRNNTASEDGGGLQAFRGSASLTDCTFEDNAAGARGGGLHLVGGSGHALLRTNVLDNASSNDAGGISWVPFGDAGALLALRDCEVRLNTAADDQGGIGIVPDGTNGKISLQGTIACANSPRPNVAGPFTNLGGNNICDCPSDLNRDGTVNGDDLGILLAGWGTCASPDCPADIVVDGLVDGADLGALLNDWVGCD